MGNIFADFDVFVFGVILIFSFVQSIFGIGLLVFGTPSLLIAGFSFSDSLAILLPCSIVISFLQIRAGAKVEIDFIKKLVAYCLFPMVLTLSFVLYFEFQASLNLFVAGILLFFVTLKFSHYLEGRAKELIAANQKTWLFVMGIVHGASNLGGGLLTILASSIHSDKDAARKLIAVCYLIFATTQLTVVVLSDPAVINMNILIYALTSGIVFSTIGEVSFRKVSDSVFGKMLGGLMFLYAVVLLLRSAGLFEG